MTALEALKIVQETPGMYTRPKGTSNIIVKFEGNAFMRLERDLQPSKFHGALPIYTLIFNTDGSPVEWEVITEEEL